MLGTPKSSRPAAPFVFSSLSISARAVSGGKSARVGCRCPTGAGVPAAADGDVCAIATGPRAQSPAATTVAFKAKDMPKLHRARPLIATYAGPPRFQPRGASLAREAWPWELRPLRARG
jgi:hypothetical protein